MNVVLTRQCLGINFYNGPYQHNIPVGALYSNFPDQVYIKPLVNYAIKTNFWSFDTRLVCRFRVLLSCLAEMLLVNAARERVNVGMQIFLRFKKRMSACENNVRLVQQIFFQRF